MKYVRLINVYLQTVHMFLCKGPEDRLEDDDTHVSHGMVTEGSSSVKGKISIV